MQQEQEPKDVEGDEYPLFHLSNKKAAPYKVKLSVDNFPIEMEIDTAAALSLISEATFKKTWTDRSMEPSQVSLCSYSGEPIAVTGEVTVTVSYKQQQAKVPLVIVKGDGPSLFGRNWLQQFHLDWQEIHCLRPNSLKTMLERHQVVFQEGIRTLKGHKVKIVIDPQALPRFCKARPVPYVLRDKVDAELDHLVSEGTLEPVQFSDWAAPIVVILKSDKTSVLICGDFKQTINPVSKLDKYPIPKVEDLFATLSGGCVFSKIDLSQAYQQLPLNEESQKLAVINTHKGSFRYTHLPFGISSAPGIFRRIMESLLQGIPGVIVYLDDILVSAPNEEEHLCRLEQVFYRLEKSGLLARENKCQFLVSEVSYLGHQIDAEGLHPLPNKVQAVVDAPSPRTVQELKLTWAFSLTMVSSCLTYLQCWLFSIGCSGRGHSGTGEGKKRPLFRNLKELLTSSQLLVH